VLFSSPSPDGSVANGGVSTITINSAGLTVDTYVTANGPQIPAAGAPCDIAAVANGAGASVWSASGVLNWTAVVAGAPYPLSDGSSLVCNLCTSTSSPAVCGQTNWTTVPGATPSGYLTSTLTYTPPVKAYTCTSGNGMTTSCTCNVAGYPAAGFIASGSTGFSICQNINGFVALGNTMPGTTIPPVGISGQQSPTWMTGALYNTTSDQSWRVYSAAAAPSFPAPSMTMACSSAKALSAGLAATMVAAGMALL
jgi:hypothetical protein